MQIDYLAPAPLGAWAEGGGQLLRETRSQVFVQAVARADGVPCLRAGGRRQAAGGISSQPSRLEAVEHVELIVRHPLAGKWSGLTAERSKSLRPQRTDPDLKKAGLSVAFPTTGIVLHPSN